MCAVSMVLDHYNQKWYPSGAGGGIDQVKNNGTWTWSTTPTREEFESLKKEVIEMKELLLKAKEYDKKNNQPDCELESKMNLIKQIAELVGVDLKEVLKNE